MGSTWNIVTRDDPKWIGKYRELHGRYAQRVMKGARTIADA